jgi:glyoxylase-like metal-dependent hydrolase (beta-lactamase superfamily II)
MIIAYLRERDAVPVLFALTHGHFDHITALPELSAVFPDVPIAIHEADAHFLGAGALERHRTFFAVIGGAGLVEQYASPLPSASVFLIGGMDLGSALSSVPDTGSELSSVPAVSPPTGWHVIHTPGHSKGSVCLYNEKDKVLISGDTLFKSGVGRG